MEITIAIVVGMIAFVLYSLYHVKNVKRLLLIKLKEQWGEVPTKEYSSEMFESIKAYYLSIRNEQTDVDDITWNDLDMDDIFMLINNTQTSIGEEYLYAFLRKPCFSKEELEERNRLMKFFAANEEKRLAVQTKLNPIGKQTVISVYEYINRLGEKEVKSNLPHYLMILGLFASIGIIFINPPVGGVLALIMLINNIMQYYKEKSQIENFLMLVAYICRLLDGTKALCHMNLPEIKTYTDRLKKDCATFKSFQRGSSWVTPKNVTGDIFSVVFDYVRMLTHIDLIKYNHMLKFFKNNRDTLNRIYANIGFIDTIIATASFRELLPYYCEPVLKHSSKDASKQEQQPGISAVDLYHPLIGQPVPNSISERKSVLITGSNASGKSTFIKTLAINAILAQTIDTSTSRSYEGSYFIIYSSMALRDNLFNQESYYMVEIKSLKRILNVINDEIPVLCFVDEVLRGTNTLERIAASSRILVDIAKKNALVFAATHDIELTHILEKHYSNYHFQERIENNEVLFDYKLYEGKAISKNAIKLLTMLKFPKEITTAAEAAAEEFLVSGEWNRIE